MARPVLEHRLILRPEAESESVTAAQNHSGNLAESSGAPLMAPRTRLILLSAVITLPLLTVAWAAPAFARIAAAILAAAILGVIADAVFGIRALAEAAVEFPPGARWTKNRETTLTLKLQNAPPELTIAADFPDAIQWRADSPSRIHCKPLRRGDYQLTQCYLEAASPCGLWSIRATRPIRTLIRVSPDLRHDRTAAAFLYRTLAGMHLQRQLGQGREFEKLRDSMSGDSFDEIHWKATERRGWPISKQLQIERTQEVYVVIDSSRLTARADSLEQFVNASLVLAIAADRQGDPFGLITFSDKVDKFVRARSGMAHFLACRNAIYALQPRPVSPGFEEVFSFIETRLEHRALLIFLTELDDPLLAETFSHHCGMIARRHMAVVAVPQQAAAQSLFAGELPRDTGEVYQRLASHLAYRDLTELKKKVERQGLRFALLRPEHIAADLAALYLAVKRSQTL
jgi:uncharacterized protein (DUF58 family)